MVNQKIKATDLQLGDVVTLGGAEPYSDATVVNIGLDNVTLVRPYVHISDFVYTGGVISYIGQENVTLYGDSEVTLVRRQDPEEHRRRVQAIVDKLKIAVEHGRKHEALELVRQL